MLKMPGCSALRCSKLSATEWSRVKEIMRRVMKRNHAGLSGEMLERGAEAGARKRHGIIVHPLRVISWDHRKLARR